MYHKNQVSIKKAIFSGTSLCITWEYRLSARFHLLPHIRVRYQYHPRGSAPLLRGPTVLSSVPSPALAAQPFQGPVRVPPSRLGASVQRANRPELGAFTSSCGTAISISGSGLGATLTARLLCSEGQPPSLSTYQTARQTTRVNTKFHHKQNHNHSQTKWQCVVLLLWKNPFEYNVWQNKKIT